MPFRALYHHHIKERCSRYLWGRSFKVRNPTTNPTIEVTPIREQLILEAAKYTTMPECVKINLTIFIIKLKMYQIAGYQISNFLSWLESRISSYLWLDISAKYSVIYSQIYILESKVWHASNN